MNQNELYHHGIKGQRWGVRRYQNPDGSLTAAGQKRKKKYEDWSNKRHSQIDKKYDKRVASTKKLADRVYDYGVRKNDSKAVFDSVIMKKYGVKQENIMRKMAHKKVSAITQDEYYARKRRAGRQVAAAAIAGPFGTLAVGTIQLAQKKNSNVTKSVYWLSPKEKKAARDKAFDD